MVAPADGLSLVAAWPEPQRSSGNVRLADRTKHCLRSDQTTRGEAEGSNRATRLATSTLFNGYLRPCGLRYARNRFPTHLDLLHSILLPVLLSRDGNLILDDSDMYGVEMGLRLVSENEDEVVLISMAPNRTTSGLQTALAIGAARALLLATQPWPVPTR